jgi:zinc/manganese transport system substrate-binding protein
MRNVLQKLAGVTGLCLGLAALSVPVQAEKLEVVASFSILADFAKEVGGEDVAVTSLVGPNGDSHVYEPTPKDVQKVALARVIVVNGLGLEGWLGRLLEASGSKALLVEASKGVTPIGPAEHGSEHAHGDAANDDNGRTDPHAFQDVGNAIIYIRNIAEAFCKAAPDACTAFQRRAGIYTTRLEALDLEVKAAVARIPEDKRRIISSHDAFGYFAHAYGVMFLAPEGVSTDAEASAKDVAKLIEQIRAQKASALFVENISDKRLIEQIARETRLKVSGVLFSDALSPPEGPASTYVQMMRHNVRTIGEAINQGS